MTIGDRIRRIRKKRRLTQAELAMMSGLSLSAIQGYEQGRYEPKRKSLESIAEVFKIPVDELYDMPDQLGTNLAEVGADLVSKRVIDVEGLDEQIRCEMCVNPMHTNRGCDGNCRYNENLYKRIIQMLDERIKPLSSAQPDIIRCRNCKFASGDSRICMKFGHSPIGELDFCAWAERRADERHN